MESLIKRRESPQTVLALAKGPYVATWENAKVYQFAEPYSHLDHIYLHMGQASVMLFNWHDTLQELVDREYPREWAPEPTEQDVRNYLRYQDAMLDIELKKEDH